jgi:hypothetical protein
MASTRRKPGQLGPQVEDYRAWLAHRGYTPQTIRNMLADLGRVGRWMSREGLVAAQLDEDAMAAFRAAWQAAGRRRALGPRAMMPLLSYLREAGVTPATKPPQTPLEALLAEYRIWLAGERVWRRPRCCGMATLPAASCSSRPWPVACWSRPG